MDVPALGVAAPVGHAVPSVLRRLVPMSRRVDGVCALSATTSGGIVMAGIGDDLLLDANTEVRGQRGCEKRDDLCDHLRWNDEPGNRRRVEGLVRLQPSVVVRRGDDRTQQAAEDELKHEAVKIGMHKVHLLGLDLVETDEANFHSGILLP